MKTILYGVSPIGLGHASRAVAVGEKLRAMGLETVFATGGNAARFLSSFGFAVHDIVTEPIPSESNGVMKNAALWYLRYWLGYRSTIRRMALLLDRLGPGLVVGDEEFSCITLALDRGIAHALIADELQLGFARGPVARLIERRVARWYSGVQQRVSHLLVPDLGEDARNVHHVGPVVRGVTKTRDEVFAEWGIPRGTKLVLFSASGSGIGRHLAEAAVDAFGRVGLDKTVLAIAGLEWKGSSDGRVRSLGFVRDNQDLVAAADLVISTAGKSTIDEAASSGTPMIAIPIKNHSEQERNARALGFVYEDIGRLDTLIPKKIAMPREPRKYDGAERIASYLGALLA